LNAGRTESNTAARDDTEEARRITNLRLRITNLRFAISPCPSAFSVAAMFNVFPDALLKLL
jgi:hypothetical protein